MVEVVVPVNPDTGRREMPSVLYDRFSAQAGGAENPLMVSGSVVKVRPTSHNTHVELGSGSGGSFQSGLSYNDDGSGGGIYCTPTANGFVAIWTTFYGRVFGIRVAAGAQPCTVSVDGGAAVRVDDYNRFTVREQRVPGASNYPIQVLTHTDLEDGVKHVARIEFPSNATATTFFGYLLDGKYYENATRAHFQSKPIAVPLAAGGTGTAYSPYSALQSASHPFGWISKIVYANPSGGAIDVSWYDSTTVVLTKTIASKDIWVETFNTPIAAGTIVHAASGSGAYVTAFGGYF